MAWRTPHMDRLVIPENPLLLPELKLRMRKIIIHNNLTT